MCGIVGYFKKNDRAVSDRALLLSMNDMILHRGPDDSGMHCSDRVGLGHRRLSIIDLSGGRQPMTDADSGTIIVFNGEIYNYVELRDKLKAKGHRFTTKSDTEVLLKLADVRNTSWLKQVAGMFACALWNEAEGKLLLARDRFGKKPLYYVELDDELLFASEIKALLCHPLVERKVNLEALPEYFAFRALSNDRTMFEGIKLLPPGHCLTISAEQPSPVLQRYWQDDGELCEGFRRDARQPILSEFERLFKECVRCRLMSDVPLGTFNSGGVDSSLVTAMTRSLYAGDLHSFSVGFKDLAYDESRYAQRVADLIGTIHHTLIIGEEEYVASLEKTVWSLEEPINHPHTVPLLMLSKMAKEYVTVVLTGEGSDEVFAGYPRYQIALLSRYARYLPSEFIRLLTAVSRTLGYRRLLKLSEICAEGTASVIESSRFVPLSDLSSCGIGSYLGHRRKLYDGCREKGRNYLEQILRYERMTYLSSLLMRLDKVSMHSGVEARVPFLDHRLVGWSQHVPVSYKMRIRNRNKIMVKAMASKWLPKDLVFRKKFGFDVPITKWLRNRQGLGRYLDYISDDSFRHRKYVDAAAVDKMIVEHLAGKQDHCELLWGLINFELWRRTFIDQRIHRG